MLRFADLNTKNIRREKGSRQREETSKAPSSFRQFYAESIVEAHAGGENEEAIRGPYEQASTYVKDVLITFRERRRFSLDQGFRIIERIVASQDEEDLYLKALHFNDLSTFLLNNMVNVAIYAIKMGDGLGFSKAQQLEIGIAGLLHDVGKWKIPEKILYKREKLSNQEFQLLREAPSHSYEVLKSLEAKYGYLAKCALQVHERIDGSGYPRGLKGDEIHEYARIIGLMDVYEALTHSRPQRERFLHFSAIKEIIHSCKRSFQSHHIKALINIFSIFPLHSYVKLNSNAIGRVIGTHPDHPMRPIIQIMYDSQGKPVVKERIIDLNENHLLYIVGSVSEEDLRKRKVIDVR